MKTFKDIAEINSQTAVFAFGRFNPPTVGHLKLATRVQKISGSDDAFIFTGFTQDPKKNPLPYKDKIKFMRLMFKPTKVTVKDTNARTVFDVVVDLYNDGYRSIKMVAGSDRIREFENLLTKYNKVKGRHGFYQFENGVKVVSAGARDPDAEGATGMSASKMRAAAADDNQYQFAKGLPGNFVQVADLFNAVRKGLGLKVNEGTRPHVQLEKVSDLRENYIKGDLFKVDDEVVLKENDEVGTIKVCGSNYVLVEFGTIRKWCWLDSVEKLEEEGGAGEWGTEELVKNYQKDTPGQEKILDFKNFVLKDDFKLTPALKIELEKIAMKLKDEDFESKSHKIATAMNILKKKHGYATWKHIGKLENSTH